MTFARWLQLQLLNWHVSEYELAYHCAISERTVRAWLAGERHPSFKQLVRIMSLVGPDQNPIFDWSEDLT